MSADRELLELAAKAAGISGAYKEPVCANPYGIEVCLEDGACTYWNSRANDGDALRLAVKLGMTVSTGSRVGYVMVNGKGTRIEYGTSDVLAATRYAITCAAAEVGRAMR